MSEFINNGMITPPSTPMWEDNKVSSSVVPTPNMSTMSARSSPSIKENVQVMVRCRPRSEAEVKREKVSCWHVKSDVGAIQLLKPKSSTSKKDTFYFDNVLEGIGNAHLYKVGILNLVKSAMMGYNGTVFAYGQTASGKTYTMMGTDDEPGVIPRSIQDVFSYIEEDTCGREYLLRVSYMEIYNEQIKDLLNDVDTSPEIVEDKKGVYVRNLKEVKVKTPSEVMNCIKKGESNRHISATDYNKRSSRSHTIFQLIIESRSKNLVSGVNRGVRVSQLNLIDLAGSEKVTTDAERRKEGAYINKSLLNLGNVISKLTSDIPASHIPFRNSKLTRILQASLSGNARISVICTINPTLASRNESLNTLRFAQHAKLIKTAAKMSKIIDDSELQNCLVKINELQTEMQERNELEAETKERLNDLLSLILTSSKVHNPQDEPMMSNWSDDDTSEVMASSSSMRDVVVQCRESFVAYQREIAAMRQEKEAMQDMFRVMESVHAKQAETLAKRDTQILKLEQELAAAKAEKPKISPKATIYRTSRASSTPIHDQVVKSLPSSPPANSDVPQEVACSKDKAIPDSSTTPSLKLQDFSSAVSSAAEKISEAVSAGVGPSFQKDVFAQSAGSIIESSVASVLGCQVEQDPSGITTTIAKTVADRKKTPVEKKYVPYSQSIKQSLFPLGSLLFNRYTLLFLVAYLIP